MTPGHLTATPDLTEYSALGYLYYREGLENTIILGRAVKKKYLNHSALSYDLFQNHIIQTRLVLQYQTLLSPLTIPKILGLVLST